MIQRIQTVHLAVAAILLAIPMMMRTALFTIQSPQGTYRLFPANVTLDGSIVMQTMVVLATISIALALLVYAVLQFKDRKFQMNLIKVSILCQLCFLVSVFFYFDKVKALVAESAATSATFSPLLSGPVVAILFCLLAIRAIRKDEELVRSADRLR